MIDNLYLALEQRFKSMEEKLGKRLDRSEERVENWRVNL